VSGSLPTIRRSPPTAIHRSNSPTSHRRCDHSHATKPTLTSKLAWTIRRSAERDRNETIWYGPIAEVLLGAGLRLGEALALEWRDVDLDGNHALRIERTTKLGGVGTPKGNRPRTVFVGPALVEILRRHRAASGRIAGLVFPSATGTHVDRNNLRRRGHDVALQRAGITAPVRPHDLRHTYATIALASGASIYFVKEQLGHADIQTTIDLYGPPTRPPIASRPRASRRSGARAPDESLPSFYTRIHSIESFVV
jgi:integrase